MESEKVKEIKKGLKDHSIEKLKYQDGIKIKEIDFTDILTLINELESENYKLKQHKRELEGGQRDLLKVIKEFDKETQQLKDRIVELEKENEKLLDSVETVQNDRCVFKCELTKKHLKQFAERLKEHPTMKIYSLHNACERIPKAIDETLKEYEG